MKNRLTLSAFVLAAALLALGSLAAVAAPTASNALPQLAQGPRAPRLPCVLPLIMGDLWGRAANAPDPRRDIDAVDALWLLRKVAGFELPEGGHGCSPTDIDCSGKTETVDALWVLRWVAELPYTQHEPCPDIGTEVPHM